MKKTAILVDGDFFLRAFLRKVDPNKQIEVDALAKQMWRYWLRHIDKRHGDSLYRIFFYDCPPLTKKIHHPLSREFVDFGKTTQAIFRSRLHQELIKQPYVATRFGFLDENSARWTIKNDKLNRQLIRGEITADTLKQDDLRYYANQKGVDMKIGLDIATLVLKKQVTKIVLISGDSDFVPAAKLARMEGCHFILDAMYANIKPDLSEHIDGLKSFI